MNSLKNTYFYNMLERQLKDQKDVIIKKEERLGLVLFYQEQLCNINMFNMDYIELIRNEYPKPLDQIIIGVCKEYKKEHNLFLDGLLQIIFSGLLVIYDNNKHLFYILDISQSPSRSTSDSLAEPDDIIGSRDGFVENYKTNIALLRTRLKSSNLEIDEFCIGRRSKTYVGLLSINDIHDQSKRKRIKREFEKIDIDAVTNIFDITESIQGRRMLPSYQYSGSPDLATRHLLDGQFIVIIDRVPTVMIIPPTFSLFTRQVIDNMNVKYFSFIERAFVLMSLIASTVFLGLFTSFLTYQSDSMSLLVLGTFRITQKGVIFPIYVEILFVLLLFELYYMVGFRSPKVTISSTIVLVGGIIIGQNTIASGLAGVMVMTFTALIFLTTFTVTSNIPLIMWISVVRITLLLASIYLGLFGLMIGVIVILSRLYKENSFGVGFFEPFLPFDFNGVKYFFTPQSKKHNKKRPEELNVLDKKMKV